MTIKAGQTKETLTLHQKSMRSILRLKEVFYKYKLEFRIFKQYFFFKFQGSKRRYEQSDHKKSYGHVSLLLFTSLLPLNIET